VPMVLVASLNELSRPSSPSGLRHGRAAVRISLLSCVRAEIIIRNRS